MPNSTNEHPLLEMVHDLWFHVWNTFNKFIAGEKLGVLWTLEGLMRVLSLINVMNICQRAALKFPCVHKFQFRVSYHVDKSV